MLLSSNVLLKKKFSNLMYWLCRLHVKPTAHQEVALLILSIRM